MAEDTDTTTAATPLPTAAEPQASAPAAAAAPPPAAAPQGTDEADVGLFAVAEETDATPPKGADGKPTKPDWVADQFWDAEKGEIRTRELAKSQADLRAKVSRGEGKMPDKPEGYALPKIEGLPDNAIPSDDPLWTQVRQAAHGAGVTQPQLEALVAPYLQYALAQKAAADPTADREAMRQAAVEELKTLGPNGTVLVKDIGAWLAGMETRGSLSKDEVRALKGVGSAAGIKALAKLRELTGEKPMPLEHLVADTMSERDARNLMVEGKQQNNQEKVERARAALQRLEQAGLLGRSAA
jgi:hypothetical protein